VATEKKETSTGLCENKDTNRKDITCSHAMLAYIVNINNLTTKYNLHGYAWYDNL